MKELIDKIDELTREVAELRQELRQIAAVSVPFVQHLNDIRCPTHTATTTGSSFVAGEKWTTYGESQCFTGFEHNSTKHISPSWV